MTIIDGKPRALTMGVIDSYLFLSCGADLVFNIEMCQAFGLAYRDYYKKSIEREIAVSASNFSFDELMNMCAEMGKIDQFYNMTPKQIEVGYQGYKQNLENLGNLYIVAERRSKDSNSSPIELQSSHSRAETMNKLNLKED